MRLSKVCLVPTKKVLGESVWMILIPSHVMVCRLNILSLKHVKRWILHDFWIIHILGLQHWWSTSVFLHILVDFLCEIGVEGAHIPILSSVARHVHTLCIRVSEFGAICSWVLLIKGSTALISDVSIVGHCVLVLICLSQAPHSTNFVLLMRSIVAHGMWWSLCTHWVNGPCSRRLASLDLFLVVYLLDLSFLLATMTVPSINLVVDLWIHHYSILLLLLHGHLSSTRFTWVGTGHSTSHWLIVIIELIFKGGLGLHI